MNKAVDAMNSKLRQQAYLKKQLADATAAKDEKAMARTKSALDKLDLAIKDLADKQETAAKAREKAEERVSTALKKQQAEVKKSLATISKIKGALRGLGGKIAGAFSVAALMRFVDGLDKVAKRARDVGLTASQLKEFQHQASLSGIEAGALDVSIKAFNRNISLAAMGTGEAKTALEQMGISLRNANGASKTQSEILKETANWFAKNAGNAESAGKAARIFGESGTELLRIFEQGEGVVDKVFNAKGFDEAAAASERLKNALENASYYGSKLSATMLNGFAFISDMITGAAQLKGPFEVEYSRQEKKLNDLRQKERVQMISQQKIQEEAYKARLQQISDLDKKLENSRRGEISLEEQVKVKKRETAAIYDKLQTLEKGSVEYVEIYKNYIDKTIDLEKTELSLKEKIASAQKKINDEQEAAYLAQQKAELNSLNNEKTRYEEQVRSIEKRMEAQKVARDDFELQTKIRILEAQGRQQEVDSIKFALKRNELMDKLGYSMEQATKAQKILNELSKKQNGIEYSDEAKKKAEKILKRGEVGTVGKQQLEEAQAIVDGRILKGGFKTAAFEKFNIDENAIKSPLSSIKVDTRSELKKADEEALNLQRKDSSALATLNTKIENLNGMIETIKSLIGTLVENSQLSTQGT